MSQRFTIYLMFQPFFDKSKSLEKMGIKTLGALKSINVFVSVQAFGTRFTHLTYETCT